MRARSLPGIPVLLVVAGCAGKTVPVARPPVQTASAITGRVTLAPGVRPGVHCRGRLAITWATADEDAALRTGRAGLRLHSEVFLRHQVMGEADLCGAGASAPFRVEIPANRRVRLRAILDTERQYTRALFRGDVEGTRQGESTQLVEAGAVEVPLVLDRVQAGPDAARDPCRGGRFQRFTLDEPAVAGSAGTPTRRNFCVHLPRDYDSDAGRRFPVIYLLPGLTGTETARFALGAHELADALAVDMGAQAILVGVDTATRLGSTYMEDSAVQGDWATFSARMVREVDARYRTIPHAGGRAVAGHSTGGYNAVKLALVHPALFGVVVASAPDSLHFPSGFLTADGTRLQPDLVRWMRLDDAMASDGQMASWSADWSGASRAWPARLSDGTLIPAIWEHWLAHSPSRWFEDPARRATLEGLRGHMLLWTGRADEFALHVPTAVFSRQLAEAGFEHELITDGGGHALTPERLRAQLRWALEQLLGNDPGQALAAVVRARPPDAWRAAGPGACDAMSAAVFERPADPLRPMEGDAVALRRGLFAGHRKTRELDGWIWRAAEAGTARADQPVRQFYFDVLPDEAVALADALTAPLVRRGLRWALRVAATPDALQRAGGMVLYVERADYAQARELVLATARERPGALGRRRVAFTKQLIPGISVTDAPAEGPVPATRPWHSFTSIRADALCEAMLAAPSGASLAALEAAARARLSEYGVDLVRPWLAQPGAADDL